MMESPEALIMILLITGALVAGFTDAVVGGGGLIQVPLLFILFPEYNHVQVIATNRFASIFGTAMAAYQYWKKMGLAVETVVTAGISAAIGSFSGVFIMNKISTEVFKPMLLCIIIVLTLYTFFNKSFGQELRQRHIMHSKYISLCIVVGLFIGLYNGIIGPGTGVLLVFSLVSVLGKDFLSASASAKAINAIADAASLIGFLINKAIIFKLAIPMMVANVTGSYIGSHMAIKRGNAFVRYFFLVIVSILILRLGWDIWNMGFKK